MWKRFWKLNIVSYKSRIQTNYAARKQSSEWKHVCIKVTMCMEDTCMKICVLAILCKVFKPKNSIVWLVFPKDRVDYKNWKCFRKLWTEYQIVILTVDKPHMNTYKGQENSTHSSRSALSWLYSVWRIFKQILFLFWSWKRVCSWRLGTSSLSRPKNVLPVVEKIVPIMHATNHRNSSMINVIVTSLEQIVIDITKSPPTKTRKPCVTFSPNVPNAAKSSNTPGKRKTKEEKTQMSCHSISRMPRRRRYQNPQMFQSTCQRREMTSTL